jgi:oxygen-dependent protoporphyrinogen oxidase
MGDFDAPSAIRVSRWPQSFPQYRPEHRRRVKTIETALESEARRLFVTGAAYGGIGIPATINTARATAEKVRSAL